MAKVGLCFFFVCIAATFMRVFVGHGGRARHRPHTGKHFSENKDPAPTETVSAKSGASESACDCDDAGADSKHCNDVYVFEQKDFAEGPLRIQVPGVYRAKYPPHGPKKILYNPNPNSARTDVPATGQICAISVECSGVTIDLNGGTIETGENVFSVFPPGSKASAPFLNYATILLANAAFPAFIANTPVPGGIMRFLDSPAYVAGRDILIKNGSIKNSPHFGIFGPQGHDKIAIKNICVTGCAISGITINSTDKVCLENVEIDGKMTRAVNFHLPTSHLLATKQLVDSTLQQLPNDLLLQQMSAALANDINAAFAAEAKGLTSTADSTTTQYGIVLQNGSTSPFAAYLNRSIAAQINQQTGLSNIGTACLRNISVRNIRNSNKETPLIGYTAVSYTETNNASPMFGKPWAGAQGSIVLLRNVNPFAQSLKWEDLGVQPNGSLQPTNFLKANVYLMALAQNTPATQTIVIHPAFVQAVLGANPTLNDIMPYVQPVLGLSAAGDFLRGTNGIVARGFGKIEACDILVSDLRNTSAVPLKLADVPGGASYANSVSVINQNFGAVVWGVFFQAGTKVSAENVRVRNLRSDVGDVFAMHLIDVEAFDVCNLHVKGLSTGAPSVSEPYVYQVLEADFATESSEKVAAAGKIQKLSRSSLSSPIKVRS